MTSFVSVGVLDREVNGNADKRIGGGGAARLGGSGNLSTFGVIGRCGAGEANPKNIDVLFFISAADIGLAVAGGFHGCGTPNAITDSLILEMLFLLASLNEFENPGVATIGGGVGDALLEPYIPPLLFVAVEYRRSGRSDL